MKTALTIALIVDCILLAIVILMQEGKENGLTGTLTGSADTYWSKNKGRSKDAMIKKFTVFLAVLFFVLAAAISSRWVSGTSASPADTEITTEAAPDGTTDAPASESETTAETTAATEAEAPATTADTTAE